MKYLLSLFLLGILCQNTFGRGLDNPVLRDFERRLVRLEARQFSESENLEHRMLQLETQLGTKNEEESNKLERNFYQISKEEKPDVGEAFLQRLENLEKSWEKKLEEHLTKLTAKHEKLSEKLTAIETQVEEAITKAMRDKLDTLLKEKIQELEQQEFMLVNSTKEISPKTGESESEFGSGDGDVEPETKSTISKEYKSQKIGSKYYYIENNEKLMWYGAVRKCYGMNAHLVSLQNEEEWSALKEALDWEHSYWTDINDRAEENVFESETTGRRAPFLMWDANEPNSRPGFEDCVEMRADRGFRMNDLDCGQSKYFICESN